MEEFTRLVDELIGRNGYERNFGLNIESELDNIFPEHDFSDANIEDIDDLFNDDEICAWIARTGFSYTARQDRTSWTTLHIMLSNITPKKTDILDKRLSKNPYARIYCLACLREDEIYFDPTPDELDLLAPLIVDPDEDVQLEALSLLGDHVGSVPIIAAIENHISKQGIDEEIQWLFNWFRRFIDGDFSTSDNEEDDWYIWGQDQWIEIANHFSGML